MNLSKNQSSYKGCLITWNEKQGYFSAMFNELFYKKGEGFKHFKTEQEVKDKIDEMMKRIKNEEGEEKNNTDVDKKEKLPKKKKK